GGARARGLVGGMGGAALLDPVADCALRVVARHEVDPEADEVRHVEPALDAAHDRLGGERSRLEAQVRRAHGRASPDAAARGARGGASDLARAVRVAEVVAKDAALEGDVAARGQALAVEGAGSEAARPPALVHEREEL